jgi:hypothetical protein
MSEGPKPENGQPPALQGEAAGTQPRAKKAYLPPALKRLGTVRELTQTTSTNGR